MEFFRDISKFLFSKQSPEQLPDPDEEKDHYYKEIERKKKLLYQRFRQINYYEKQLGCEIVYGLEANDATFNRYFADLTGQCTPLNQVHREKLARILKLYSGEFITDAIEKSRLTKIITLLRTPMR